MQRGEGRVTGGQPRFSQAILADHFARHRQMAVLSGPRQVGKTTL